MLNTISELNDYCILHNKAAVFRKLLLDGKRFTVLSGYIGMGLR